MNNTQKVQERILQHYPEIKIVFVGYVGKSKSAWDSDAQHKFLVWREGRDTPITWWMRTSQLKGFNGPN